MVARRASRLRARSSARAGLRQATRRSPGKSGEVISARSCSSKRQSWSGPSSAISVRICGERSAVIHPYLPSSSRQRVDAGGGDHAAVAGHDHFPQPEPVPHDLGDLGERCGVGGVPLEDPDRDRAALRVGEQPVLDLDVAFLPVAGVAAGAERAVRAFQPRAGQVEQGHPLRVRRRGEVAAGEALLDGVLPGLQPVHRRVHVVGRRVLDAEVGAERRVGPPGQRGQLRARVRDAGDDEGQREVALRAGRAEEPRQPEFRGHRQGGGDVAVGQRPGDRHRRGAPCAGARASPLSAASTVSTTWSGSFDRFARVSCLTLPSSR